MEQSWPSIWFLIHSWLTPAVLFLLVNCIIGTIVLRSKTLRAHHRHAEPAAGDSQVIVRTAYSALHRLRSLSLTRLRSADFFFDHSIAAASHQKSDEITNDPPKAEVEEKEDEHVLCRSQSENLPEAAEEKESSARMMKSASERPARGSFEKKKALKKEKAVEELEVGVDAKADDFINRFRQQLHLQRLNSLLNYKEMLNRGK